MFTPADMINIDVGKRDFLMVTSKTSFAGFTETDSTISTRGGFMISNPDFRNFVATGGSMITDTPDFLLHSGTVVPRSYGFPSELQQRFRTLTNV